MPLTSPTDRIRRLAVRLGVGAAHRLPAGVRRAINTARGIETPHMVPCLSGDRPVVLAPHPDDELIGAGGAMLRHVAGGAELHIVHLTSGERTAGLAHLSPVDRAPTREAEAIAAAKALGLGDESVNFLRFPDGGLDADDGDQFTALGQHLDSLKPDLVYAPWPIDPHRDHTATTAMLCRVLADMATSPTVALYEVWNPLSPTHIVDITDELDTKLAALGAYQSALDSVDYLHTARGLAAYRSGQGMHGHGFAEAFAVMSAQALAGLVDQVRDSSASP